MNRETLGTIVTVTAFGPDRDAVESAVDDAFSRMAEVEAALNAYPAEDSGGAPPSSDTTAGLTVAEFNQSPYDWHLVHPDVAIVLARAAALGIDNAFSPTLKGVMDLWDFGGEGSIPAPDRLKAETVSSWAFTTRETPAGVEARFYGPEDVHPEAVRELMPPIGSANPGLDLSGASKGLALDRALETLRGSGNVTAALITSGSTTVTLGAKPDGTPWRIGVEDPRDPEATVAIVEAHGEITVSTSGDYQQYFERDGMRYHHILDPQTGMPAQGLRSLTVVGAADGLDSDALSTALFVMGPAEAEEYARRHGLGLVLVDDEGAVAFVEAPSDAPWSIAPAE